MNATGRGSDASSKRYWTCSIQFVYSSIYLGTWNEYHKVDIIIFIISKYLLKIYVLCFKEKKLYKNSFLLHIINNSKPDCRLVNQGD